MASLHHTLLHSKVETGNAAEEIVCSDTEKDCSKRPYFMTVPVRVCYGGRKSLTYAMFDTGSQRTFCGAGLIEDYKPMDPSVLFLRAPCLLGREEK